MRIIGFIPARYGSTRFKAKALADLCGKPMVEWVYENAKKATKLNDLIVLTDDTRIADACKKFGAKFAMTDTKCKSGTERIISVAGSFSFDVAVNIQGDEPLVCANDLDNLTASLEKDSSISVSTLIKKIKDEPAISNPNIVKVIKDTDDNAIYFSRSTIPCNRENSKNVTYYQHIGIYAYTKNILEKFDNLKGQTLEHIEKLEQLRFLENGYKIKTIETMNKYIGVDTEEDLAEVVKYLNYD